MEETPHLVARFMAAGAGQRLEDYHFLRNTYETVSGQEVQLNRILRMLDQDEIALNWHIDTTPIGRTRSRSVYDYDRTGDTMNLPGRIAYQRLRERELEDLKRQPSPQVSSRVHGLRERRQRLSQQHDTPPLSNSDNDGHNPSAARLRALAEYDAELAEYDAKRRLAKEKKRQEDDNVKSGEIELISFTVRYEDSSSSNKKSGDADSLGRILCDWVAPSSSSGMKYYTIERQLGDKEWLPTGEKIDASANQAELAISSLISDDDNNNNNNQNVPARFRLKAHLENGKTFTSKPTDEINIDLTGIQGIIKPNVEILSANSVQLIWKKDESAGANMYDIEKKDAQQTQWEKVTKVSLSQGSAQVDNLIDAHQCQFRLVPSKTSDDAAKSQDEVEPEVLTVQNVNEWLTSIHLVPTSSTAVDIDISEEGFKAFDRYKVEYTTIDQLDQWKQMPDITHDVPHLTIDNLKQGAEYKFRLTPVLPGTTTANEANSSHLSLVLDLKMPPTKKGRLIRNESLTRPPPPQFAIHQTNPTSVLIEAIVPTDKPVLFDDVFDVYSKKETPGSDWTKIGTIDKDHLNLIIKNLEENTAYAFKIDNKTSPSSNQHNIIQEFKYETASVKLYDPSLFLEKVEQSLENVVNTVMRAAAGHQTLDDPMNISLNEVIKGLFHEENLIPNEQYGFDTLALSSDLQLFRGPKQMMLQELEITETSESSKAYGEIIIHNYRQAEHEQQPVIVREENGNTRIGNIDGDVIVRNVITDVLLVNEETRNQLSMNIVGQAFLKGVQGILIASKFKGIIVVKTVNKP